jgi:acetyl esterase/lipase
MWTLRTDMKTISKSRRLKMVWVMMALALGILPGGTRMGRCEGNAEGVELVQAIQYGVGDGQPLLLDLAEPKGGGGPYPALVFVHGGGWAAGDRSAYHDLMMGWVKFGIVCVSVDYRLAPKYRFPAQLEDVKCAVRWVRANAAKYHIDPQRVGAVGGSAGAHLVGMMGTTSGTGKWEGTGGNADRSSAIQMMICHGTPSDLLMAYEHTVTQREQEGTMARGLLTGFLGGTPEQVKTAYLDASPVQHVSKATPPALLLHGADDPLVLLEQAEVFAAALEKAGVPVELVRMEGAGHGGFGKEPEKIFARMTAFLQRYLLQK